MATLLGPLCRGFISQHLDAKSTFNPHEAFPLDKKPHHHHHLLLMKRKKQLIKSINVADVTVTLTSDPPQVDITWQIVVGSLGTIHTPMLSLTPSIHRRISSLAVLEKILHWLIMYSLWKLHAKFDDSPYP
ncbi:hypothetical protein FXO37_20184 [Capsicum annuum]|nr:hypothetical protein FXO37_20184 [Capsicum annuum]